MGFYSEYLDRNLSFQQLTEERKRMLARISELRKRDILVYAADVMKAPVAPVALAYDDLLPITDQLQNLNGKALDMILETGGGSGETAEDIVRILRSKFESVAFIVPGIAKSAGTIMVMSGDEILMDANSALGPIDAQIQYEGKQFSAEALLKGFEKIKAEADTTKSLNRAYIPLLQRISPGDLQHAENALEFAKVLVTDWLFEHKYKKWNVHRTHNAGTPVTDDEKRVRAAKVASDLCDHSRWLTHGRSIRIQDLHALGVEVTDFSENKDLGEAIRRYHVLAQMMFNQTSIYKLIETPSSQIIRFMQTGAAPLPAPGQPQPGQPQEVLGVLADVQCPKCKKVHKVQVDFDTLKPLQTGVVRYPPNDMLVCDQCGTQINLAGMRQQLEMQTKRQVAKK
jgi:hypothetical protein